MNRGAAGDGRRAMMLLVFAAMSAAFVALLAGRVRLAVACALGGILLAAALFLSEIHSPTDGFAMPWLQGRAAPLPRGLPA